MCLLTQGDLETAGDGAVWIKASRKKTKIDYDLPLLDLPLHILFHFFIRYMCVYLRGGYGRMAHHAVNSFQWHSHREGNMCSEIVPGLMECYVVDPVFRSQFRNQAL